MNDGMLYKLAVFRQDLEENTIPTALRAEPSTLARLWDLMRHHTSVRPSSIFTPTGPCYFDGIRLEEDNKLPPSWLDMIDHKGRVMRRFVLLRR